MNDFDVISFRILNESLGKPNVVKIKNSLTFYYPCVNTSICSPYEMSLSPGLYKFELWGAQGGDARYQNVQDMRKGSGGRGAYVSGILQINTTRTFYL